MTRPIGLAGVIADAKVQVFAVQPTYVDLARQRITAYRRSFNLPERLTALFPFTCTPSLSHVACDVQNLILLLARSLVDHAREADEYRALVATAGLHDLTGWAYFLVRPLPGTPEGTSLSRLPPEIADATAARHWLYRNI